MGKIRKSTNKKGFEEACFERVSKNGTRIKSGPEIQVTYPKVSSEFYSDGKKVRIFLYDQRSELEF